MSQREKTGGREKGTPNKTTQEIRDKFQHIVNSFSEDSIIKDLKSLQPNERLRHLTAMCEYIAPKYQRITHELDLEQKVVSSLSHKEREEEIQRLLIKGGYIEPVTVVIKSEVEYIIEE